MTRYHSETLRIVPEFTSDAEAEAFIEQDLSDLDFSQFRPVRFQFVEPPSGGGAASDARMPGGALEVLAGSVSVSCRERLDPVTLDAILRAGCFEERWAGHVAALVEEAPIAMLAAALASYPPDRRPAVLAGFRALGRAVGSDRIERWMTG